MVDVIQEMSYTTSLKTSEFREITTDLVRAFFSQKYENTAYLPPSLRFGSVTFEAAKKLMDYETLWFNHNDKVDYLLGKDTTLHSYHDYWSLLSKIWPREKSKEISDLVVQARTKLRAIIFFEMAGRQEYLHSLPTFFDKYLANGLRNPARKKVIKSLPLLQNSQRVKESLASLGNEFTLTFRRNLEKMEKSESVDEILEIVHSLFNKQHFVYIFSPMSMIELVEEYFSNLKEPSWDKAVPSLKQKAIIGAAHLCDKKEWQVDWIKHLIDQLSDVRFGRSYALFGTLYVRNNLNKTTFASLEEPNNEVAQKEVWSATAADEMINDALKNTYPPWYMTGDIFQMVNILRLMNYIRSHPNINLVLQKLPTARLRIRNIARHFLKKYSQKLNSVDIENPTYFF